MAKKRRAKNKKRNKFHTFLSIILSIFALLVIAFGILSLTPSGAVKAMMLTWGEPTKALKLQVKKSAPNRYVVTKKGQYYRVPGTKTYVREFKVAKYGPFYLAEHGLKVDNVSDYQQKQSK
ncbi:hypothetical protein EQG49_00930 [Periweissella cryptocerci]|uniref:Uncharacterized protein n=1 Tax=Periweissella cryptocerci TaxID=2506420 RepID=A0A4P6YR65_9LACO|nr:hypothetical protein [Periweissella cryptocerci]QBO35118.1 hypothetical protein EQG49_00930 [Periweissella cryptocerci]